MDWHKGNSGNWDDEVVWKPEEADELVGKIVAKSTVETKYGPTVVLKVEAADETVYTVWCNRGGLKNIIEQYDDELTVGREIGLRTPGKTTLKNGNDFYPYEIGFSDMGNVAPEASGGGSALPVVEEPF